MHSSLPLIAFVGLAFIPLAAQTPSATPPDTSTAPASPAPTAPVPTSPVPVNIAPASVAPAPTTAPANQPIATAVLNFQSSDETINKQGAELATMLEADLSTSEHALTVEREDIDKILNEEAMGKSGLVSADTAAKIGSLTGAQVLVTGRLFASGNQYMIVAKIMSTGTSRVYGVTATANDLSGLPQAAQDLSGKIDGVLASHRDVLVPVEETSEQRLQKLRTILGQRPLPSVSVAISERDYTQPTIDPAAQTEIMMLLQQLGFQVIDSEKDHKKADIAITGEAFSELGTRHGNLVSSRGRIELKITRTSNQQLLWTDRETAVGVDIGNRTAGKDALQKAADILVERMLPKLTK